VSESIFSAADLLLVPIVPSTLSVRTFEQLQGFLARAGDPAPDVLAFLSMVDRRKKLHRELVESLPRTLPAVAETPVPSASVVELMGVRRAPVVATLPSSPAAKAYVALWARVRETLDSLP
jgi:chromosome partitioning protein